MRTSSHRHPFPGRALVLGALLLSAATIHAANLDTLVGSNDAIMIEGRQFEAVSGDGLGYSVSGTGDVNGDGLADLVIGAPTSFTPNAGFTGRTYVMFGTPFANSLTAFSLFFDGAGTAFSTNEPYSRLGRVVSGAGDFNGDGFDDFITSAPQHDYSSSMQGRAFIVFGGADLHCLTETDLMVDVIGFTIFPQGTLRGAVSGSIGKRASGAGDFNGDGFDDVIITSDKYSGANDEVFIVYGRDFGLSLNLGAFVNGVDGVRITGISSSDGLGDSVSGAGDVNGDGFDDVIITYPNALISGEPRGEALVVFGGPSLSLIRSTDVALGSGGFAIIPQDSYAYNGMSVSCAGDVNNDGLADVVVGTNGGIPPGSYSGHGVCYVVFGKATTTAVQGSAILAGTGGFAIVGEIAGDGVGTNGAATAVSCVGDVNRDSRSDLLVSSVIHNPGTGTNTGTSYLVFGKTTGATVQLSTLRTSSPQLVFDGGGDYDAAGIAVNPAGDLNGDGIPDLAIGTNIGYDLGRAYVVFGDTAAGTSANYRRHLPPGNTPMTQIGGTGDRSLFPPDSHAWVKHNGGSLAGGPSLLTVQYSRSIASLSNVPGNPLNFYWQLTTARTGITNTEIRLHYNESQLGGVPEESLQLYRSSNQSGPWSHVTAVHDLERNEFSATVTALRYFVITGDDTGPNATVAAMDPVSEEDDYRMFAVHFSEQIGGTFSSLDVTPTGSLAAVSTTSVHQEDLFGLDYMVVVALNNPENTGDIGISLAGANITDLFGNPLAGFTGIAPVAVTNYPDGDVNQDGAFNIADVALLADANLGLVTLP